MSFYEAVVWSAIAGFFGLFIYAYVDDYIYTKRAEKRRAEFEKHVQEALDQTKDQN